MSSVDRAGTVTELGSEILDLLVAHDSVIVATADGQLRSMSPTPD